MKRQGENWKKARPKEKKTKPKKKKTETEIGKKAKRNKKRSLGGTTG